jgi:hypothetical protein
MNFRLNFSIRSLLSALFCLFGALRGHAALTYSLNAPTALTAGGYVLAADGVDADATTNRHEIQVTVTGSVTRTLGTPASVQERLTLQLLDSGGNPQDLDDGAGGVSTTFATVGSTYIYPLFLPPATRQINGSVRITPKNLPASGTGYRVRARVQAFNTVTSSWTTTATADSAPFSITFFGNTVSADDSRNLVAEMSGLAFTRSSRILSVPGKDMYVAQVTVDMSRYDGFADVIGDATVAGRLVWTLEFNSPAGAVGLGAGESLVTLNIPSYAVVGGLPAPATATQTLSLPFAPGSPLAPGLLDNCKLVVSLFTAEQGPGEALQGNASVEDRLGTFTGVLTGGGTSANFTEVSFEQTTVTQLATGYRVRITIPAGEASLAGPGGLSFGVAGVFMGYNWSTGDLEVLADALPVAMSAPLSAAGVGGQLTNVSLTNGGLQAQQMTVYLPPGFGYTGNDARRRVMDVDLTFSNVALTSAGAPSDSSLTYAPGTFYLAHDTLPERYQVTSLTWNIAAGTFTSVGTPHYVRALEDGWLSSDANLGRLTDNSAAHKLSNDGVYKSTDSSSPTNIVVTAAGALSATITLDALADPWLAHFPKGSRVPTVGGVVEVVAGLFAAASTNQLDNTVVTKQPRGPTACGVTDPGDANLYFTAAANIMTVTTDGGWRANGTTPAGQQLQWGGFHGTEATHAVGGVLAASFHIPGTRLLGSDAPGLTGAERVAALLLSGHGQPGNTAYVERPREPAYADGLADYAGLNLRNTASTAVARSYLAEQNTGAYSLQPWSKYYARLSGVSGIHHAVTKAALSNLKLYKYNTTLNGLRLAFLSNLNTDSATSGSLVTPFPSGLSITFSKLTFTPTGGLDRAELPDIPTQQTLTYWSTPFTPLAMSFTGKTEGACLPGQPEVRFLTLAGKVEAPQISSSPIYGSLGFKPDGNMVTAADNLAGGLDSSLPAPAVIPIKARGNYTYPLRPATRVRFNNLAAAEPGDQDSGDGFLCVSGSVDVPFFEDIRVMVHLIPGNIARPVHIMGGYPSDPQQARRGWAEGTATPFDLLKFDSEARCYPLGMPVDDFRGKTFPDNQYRVHLRKDWRKLIAFEFPMLWDAGTRGFLGIQKTDLNLVVITAEAQVKKLDAQGVEITFGAEFAGLPKLNTESLSRVLSDATDELTGMDKKIADALSNAVTGQINDTFIKEGREAVDSLLADTAAKITDLPLRAALENVLDGPLDTLQNAMQVAYNAGGDALNAIPLDAAVLNARQTLADAASATNQLRNALTGATNGASSLVNEIARQLDKADKGLGELEKLCDTKAASGAAADITSEFIYKIARSAIKEIFNEDFLVSGNAQVRDTLSNLMSEILEEAGPALAEARDAIRQVRALLAQLRSGVDDSAMATAKLSAQINTALSDAFAMRDMILAGVDRFINEVVSSRDAAKRFFVENSPEVLRERLIKFILDSFHASPVGVALRGVVTKMLDPVRKAFNQGVDLVMAEINSLVNEVVLKITGELKTLIINPLVDSITTAVQGAFKAQKQAQGNIPSEYGKSAPGSPKVMAMAKVQGYVRTRGDTLDFLRVDAEVGLKVPDGFDFKGYFQISNVDSNTPGVSCRGGGGAQTEIIMGATAGVSLKAAKGAGPDKNFKLTFDAKFSLDGAGGIIGFDGFAEIQSNAIDFGGFSIQRLTLSVGIGGGEAYLFGGAFGSIWLVEVEVDAFFGITKQVAVLRKALDPESFKAFIQPAIPPGNPACLDKICVGTGFRATGRLSLNRLVGIPETCLLNIKGGVMFGNTMLLYPEAPGLGSLYRIGYGQRQGYTLTGQLLCVIGIEGNMGLFLGGSVALPGTANAASLDAIASAMIDNATSPKRCADLVSSLEATGHGWIEACVSLLFLEVCGRIDVVATVKPLPPSISFRVEF